MTKEEFSDIKKATLCWHIKRFLQMIEPDKIATTEERNKIIDQVDDWADKYLNKIKLKD